MKKVYLSGAIEHAPDEGRAWRNAMEEWLTTELGHVVYNPNKEKYNIVDEEEAQHFRSWRTSDYPRFKSIVRRFIERDLKVILNDIDYVICYWDEYVLQGGGTHGELTMSFHSNIPVFLVLGVPIEDVSAWILGCSTKEFQTFDQLKLFLKEWNGND